jgi:hypothetical protein
VKAPVPGNLRGRRSRHSPTAPVRPPIDRLWKPYGSLGERARRIRRRAIPDRRRAKPTIPRSAPARCIAGETGVHGRKPEAPGDDRRDETSRRRLLGESGDARGDSKRRRSRRSRIKRRPPSSTRRTGATAERKWPRRSTCSKSAARRAGRGPGSGELAHIATLAERYPVALTPISRSHGAQTPRVISARRMSRSGGFADDAQGHAERAVEAGSGNPRPAEAHAVLGISLRATMRGARRGWPGRPIRQRVAAVR